MFRLCLSFVCGAVAVVGFSPVDWWPVVILSVMGLCSLVLSKENQKVFLLGWFYGLGFFGFGVGWIQVSVHQFGIPSYFFSYGVTAALVMFLSLYFGIFAALLRYGLNNGLHLMVSAPALWILMEYSRGYFFSGFPWLSLGYSQLEGPLSGYVPLIGTLGCSFLIVLVGCLFLELFRGRKSSIVYRLSALASVFLIGVVLRFYEFTASSGAPLDVTLIQGAIPQEIKWHPDIRQPSIERYKNLSAEHWDADIIIWPETAIPAFRDEVEEKLTELASLSVKTDTDLLVGIPRVSVKDGRTYNSVALVDGGVQVYDKRHLVPFGEYLPVASYLGWLVDYLKIPMSDFGSGASAQALIQLSEHKIGVSICYESVFPNLVHTGVSEAAFFVNLSNDAWFGDTIGPHQHLQIARMRALEAGRYFLRSTNNGLTAIINDKGEILAQAAQFVPTYLRGQVQPKAGLTFYTRFGDGPLITLVGLLFIFNLFFKSDIRSYRSRSYPYN